MPDPATYLAFVATSLAYLVTPDPDMMLVMSRGIGQGRRVALCTAFGCVAAGMCQRPLLALGLASVLRPSPFVFDLLALCIKRRQRIRKQSPILVERTRTGRMTLESQVQRSGS